jgi:hypothetical protein
MATTDIDGTPIVMLTPAEAKSTLIELRSVVYSARRHHEKLIAKLEKFLADPDVTEWEEN